MSFDPAKVYYPDVQWRMYLDKISKSIDDLLVHPDELLRYYSKFPHLTYGQFKGGLFIKADGVTWFESPAITKIDDSVGWIHAVKEILDGKPQTVVHLGSPAQGVQDYIRIVKNGNNVELEGRYLDFDVVPKIDEAMEESQKITFNFKELATQILREGKKFFSLMEAEELIKKPPVTESLLKEIERKLSRSPD